MEQQLPHEVKMERLQRLQAKQRQLTGERLLAWKGKRVEVLLEGASEADPEHLQGRSSQNITVNLVKSYADLKPGMIVDVQITDVGRHTLKGEVIESLVP